MRQSVCAAYDLGVDSEDEVSSLVAGIAVFLAPRREHLCGISDIPATADRISEPGPVVKRPVKRELKDRASLPRLDVRPVVAHAARVVSEVEFLEEVEGLGGHLPCGRAVPSRLGSAGLVQRGKAPLDLVALLTVRRLVRAQMEVAVMGYRVTSVEQARNQIRVQVPLGHTKSRYPP